MPPDRAAWIVRGFLFLALMLLAITVAIFSYMGVCLPLKRILSNEEKINLALQYVNNRQTLPVQTADSGLQYFQQVKYKNVENIREAYPNCCEVGENVGGDVWPPTFWKRLFGEYSDVVRVKYTTYYLNSADEKVPYNIDWSYVMTNCGVWQD